MNELYFPEAVVLNREDSNDADSRFSIYAKGFGKFFAKAKSARKILSKLSGHLEPGNLVKIRLVGNGSFQVVDALKFGKVEISSPDLYFLDRILPEQDFDFKIWEILIKGNTSTDSTRASTELSRMSSPQASLGQVAQNFDWCKVLKVLGWDPDHGACEICQLGRPAYFDLRGQGFICEDCVLKKTVGDFQRKRRNQELIKVF